LYNNQLNTLPNTLGNLTQLQELHLNNNELDTLPNTLGNLTQLQTLYLNNNKLNTLPNILGNLTQLRKLVLYNNKLDTLPNILGNLTQLQDLYLNDNKLTYLPTGIIRNMTQLQYLNLDNNKLTDIPIGIIYLPNLMILTYSNNEITNLHPAIIRWLNRSKTIQNVYNNNQSVHDHNIESSTNTSIIKFISNHKVNNTDVYDLIDNFNIDTKTKNLLKSYCNCDYVHSNLKLKFSEVALPVLDYINNHESKHDLLKILQDEMRGAEGKCFQGRLSRLINVINGYCPDVCINISPNEQIGNIVIMLKTKCKDLDELVGLFTSAMNERQYEPNIIDEWIVHIKENY
jgi:Leucine-rich repeat (LRR) protein